VGDVFDAAFIFVRSLATVLGNVRTLHLLARILVVRKRSLLAVVTCVLSPVMHLIPARRTSHARLR
jgi:hypothetical protein